MLKSTVVTRTADTITLTNGVAISAYPCRPQAIRGLRARVCVADDWGFPLTNVVRMFANHETFFGGFLELIRALYVEGKISPRHRELSSPISAPRRSTPVTIESRPT
jgi:hypothetical protein